MEQLPASVTKLDHQPALSPIDDGISGRGITNVQTRLLNILTAGVLLYLATNALNSAYSLRRRPAALAFLVFAYSDLALLLVCLKRMERQNKPETKERLKAAVWALGSALELALTWRVAEIMPPVIAIVVWLMATLVVVGGFYGLFIHRDVGSDAKSTQLSPEDEVEGELTSADFIFTAFFFFFFFFTFVLPPFDAKETKAIDLRIVECVPLSSCATTRVDLNLLSRGLQEPPVSRRQPLGEPTIDRQQLSVADGASPCGSDDVLLDLVRDHLVQRQQVPDVLRQDLHSHADIAEGLDGLEALRAGGLVRERGAEPGVGVVEGGSLTPVEDGVELVEGDLEQLDAVLDAGGRPRAGRGLLGARRRQRDIEGLLVRKTFEGATPPPVAAECSVMNRM
ncbi:hypothetical protein Cni_G17915 [Canna indica]|uniref:Uncharacterized protein n=1 Tax=Canna indica TaxID=4628 RepID=A0AAQ3KIA2_9LILI|nr:hypothetical protein Cni_G17915 [Canna indica]